VFIGSLTQYIDVAQLALYVFWLFFFGLVLYLLREGKREGYPLDSDRSERAPRVQVVGFPPPPPPKTFRLPHGEGERKAPHPEQRSGTGVLPGTTTWPWPGEPLRPTGDPMREALGPAAHAQRDDHPDLRLEGDPKVVPMRVATEFSVAEEDPDPRGMTVTGCDGKTAGRVTDLWVDRSEPRILFFELDLADGDDGQGPVLLPVGFARINAGQGRIRAASIEADQFTHVPRTASRDRITRLEEDRITAYFGAGHLYANPGRQEPLI
jgi:photosynthetic reaction center H subunit